MDVSHSIKLDKPGAVESFLPTAEDVRLETVMRIQGYKEPDKARKAVRRACRQAVDEANAIATPVVAWRTLAIQSLSETQLELNNVPPVAVHCEAFFKYLGNADHVVVYTLTAGAAFDARLSDLHEPDQVLHGLLLETAAWMCIENTTRQFLKWLRHNAKQQSRRITRRLGPGYQYRVGDRTVEWPLQQQQQLFDVFSGNDIPIQLLESSAMLPKMSRSGLVGVGPD